MKMLGKNKKFLENAKFWDSVVKWSWKFEVSQDLVLQNNYSPFIW